MYKNNAHVALFIIFIFDSETFITEDTYFLEVYFYGKTNVSR